MNEMSIAVREVYSGFPEPYRQKLLEIRELIFKVAQALPSVGTIEESLKWGQPSYAPAKAKIGTPIRLDRFEENRIAMFFHCQTTLVERFRMMYQGTLEFSKNRAIVLRPEADLPVPELEVCIEMALTYHKNKRQT